MAILRYILSYKKKLPVIFFVITYFLLGMFMMSACRLVYYLYNSLIFPDVTIQELARIFYGGLIFDRSILLVANVLFLLAMTIPLRVRHRPRYVRWTKWLFIVPTSVCILMNIADTVYYEVTLRRTTSLIFRQFESEGNMMILMMSFLVDYWYMIVLLMVFITVFVFLANRFEVSQPIFSKVGYYYVVHSILFLTIIVLTIAGIRGGFTRATRPITLSNASKYVSQPRLRALVLNTPFALYRTVDMEGLPLVCYFDSIEEQEHFFSAYHKGIHQDSTFKPMNVVLFIIESFGKENIGKMNRHIPNYKGYTPFFDSLIDYSLAFSKGISNSRQSISGMPANIAAIPSLGTPFILSHYSGNSINSLASELKKMGYYSAFFHGAINGSFGFDAFAQQAGFDDYFGRTEYGNDEDFDGVWGIYDEDFFQFYAEKMNEMKEPFFTAIFSLSSHHPYKIPKKHLGKFPEGPLEIHRMVGYVDYALKRFMKKASKSSWYDNTIFVFSADHSPTFPYLPEYKTLLGYFAIPIVIFEPGSDQLIGFNDSTYAQQTDIMPTILNYLNYPNDYIAFGKDLLGGSEVDKDWGMSYEAGNYHLFYKDHLIQFDGKKTQNVYSTKNDPFFKTDIKNSLSEDILKVLESKVKAYVQELNRRLIQNEMTVENQSR